MKARFKTADEILGARGITSFITDDGWKYTVEMNEIAETKRVFDVVGRDDYYLVILAESSSATYYMKNDWLIFLSEQPDPRVDLKVDEKVPVKDKLDSEYIHRHFSHFENGKIYCFRDGQSSWSSNRGTLSWGEWKLPDGEKE